MRAIFCDSLVREAQKHDDFVFLTGDLGFMALEPLQNAIGQRFINAGVAEQNMISVAAGLAKNGLRPWVYSIAPFIYARPFEQIRNDICLHNLPVIIVGNGGGYGYGVMGATHHAIEDYGTLLTLQGLHSYIPAFDEDLSHMLNFLTKVEHPAYLRLGLAEPPKGVKIPSYASWRRLESGEKWVILTVGPLAGSLWQMIRECGDILTPSLWALTELPIKSLPDEFLSDINRSPNLLIVEEHVAQGGAGQIIATQLLKQGIRLNRFETRTALGYPSKRYGSQKFHRRESQIDAISIGDFLASQGNI
jgi:transketolase